MSDRPARPVRSLPDPFQPALLTGLTVLVDHPAPTLAWERLRDLWGEVRRRLDFTESIPGLPAPTPIDPPFEAPDCHGTLRLVAAARRRGAGLWQMVLHTDGAVACARVMQCPPAGPVGGPGRGPAAAGRWDAVGARWAELEDAWDAVTSAGAVRSPTVIGETRIRVALDLDGGRELASLPVVGAGAGWWQRWDELAPDARLWETSVAGDGRARRDLVLTVPPERELALDHMVWTRGDGQMPPLARYLLRAAVLRYQIRVFDDGRPTGALRRRLDELIDDVLSAQPALAAGAEALARRLARDRALAETAVSRLAEMRRTVRRLGIAMEQDLAAAAVPTPTAGPLAADAGLCGWFTRRIGDERHDLRAVLDRAAAVAALVPGPVARSGLAGQVGRYGGPVRADSETDPSPPVVGLITALPEEFAAVRIFLDSAIDTVVPGDPNLYLRSTLRTPRGSLPVVVSQLVRPGNNVAAAMCSALLAGFPSVRDVIMVGIAAAIPSPGQPDQHVRLGDVVIATGGVLQYDNVRLATGAEPAIREPPHTPAAYLLSRVRRLAADEQLGQRPWESYLASAAGYRQFRRPPSGTDVLLDTATGTRLRHPHQGSRRRGMPMVHRGRIGGANILLQDPAIRDLLRDTHWVQAVEMEGSGVADGAWLHQVGHLVVRGTSDYADQTKNDVWHNYASLVAAAYTRALLDLYEPPAQAKSDVHAEGEGK